MEFPRSRTSLLWVAVLVLCALDSPTQALYTATCTVKVNSVLTAGIQDNVKGTVTITDPATGKTQLKLELSGFDTSDAYADHGFHIHTTDNMTVGCNSLGGHYNPTSVNHAGPADATRHYGDLGNIKEDGAGAVSTTIEDDLVTLNGTYSVIGRSIVIHQKKDDLGKGGDAESLATGNAGSRLACCIIELTSSSSHVSWSGTSVVAALVLSCLTKKILV